jgi:Uma2 family endonuclease
MNDVTEKTLLTPEDLLALPDQKSFELVNGRLVERDGSVLSSWIGGNVAGLIGNRGDRDRHGWIFGADNGCQCFPDMPNTVRRPNVSYVRAGRLSWDQINDGWLRVVPDLVVEVISPKNLSYVVLEKIAMFHRAGVPLIWIVWPVLHAVRIVRRDDSTTLLREGDELSGEDVIPGFACPVAAIFPPRTPVAPAEAKPAR